MQPPSTAGARLWQAIVRLGLSEKTQRELADTFKVPQSVVQGWKKGEGGVGVDLAIRLEVEHRINAEFVLLARGEVLLDRATPLGDYAAGYWDGRRSGLLAASEAILGIAKADEAEVATPVSGTPKPASQIRAHRAVVRGKAPRRKAQ